MQEQVRRGMETMRMVWLIQRGHLFGWVPVALACGIGLYFGLRFEPGIKTFVAVGMLQALGLLLVRRAREEVQPLGWALVLVAIGFFLSVARAHTIAAPVLGERYFGSVQGTIVGVDRSASDALRLTLADIVLANRPEMLVPARVRISLHGDAGSFHPVPGQIILATAQLSPPGGPSEPRGFDFRRHSWFQGLGAVGYTRVPIMVWRDADRSGLLTLRLNLAARIRAHLPGETGAVAAAVATGDRSALAEPTLIALRVSNLAHLLAISGLHMGLVAGFVFAAVRFGIACVPWAALRWPSRKIAAGFALVAAFFYLLLSGNSVATERAFVMTAVFLGAIFFDRRALSLRSVALAALAVLALRPEALVSPGFQMSFAATTALVGVFATIRDREWTLGPQWLRPVSTVVVSSLVAGLATAPFAAAHFNQISHYGFIANLLAVPVMGAIVMPAAVLAGVLMPIGLEALALYPMGLGLDWILSVAHVTAAWPEARGTILSPPGMVLPFVALGGLFLILWSGRARIFGAVPLLAALTLWSLAERPLILIAEDGGLVGVMTERGRALSRAKGAGFAAQVWLENDGSPNDQSAAAALWPIDTPMLLPSGVALRHVTGKRRTEGLECEASEWVITNARPPMGVACKITSLADLSKSGALAIYSDGRQETTNAHVGSRLWTQNALQIK